MTAEAVLERAQSAGLHLHLDGGQLRLSGDKSALAGLLPELRQHRTELVQLLQSQSIDQMPPDPGMARLLALAMALCDRTGASEKERQDWRADIEQAAPEHRGHLLALVHSLMPAPPPTALEIAAPAPKPLPKFHVAQPWNKADKAYQAHHWNCPTCKAAARSGHSDRCATGQQLHQLYEQAFEAAKGATP